jgi:hypothetical protein
VKRRQSDLPLRVGIAKAVGAAIKNPGSQKNQGEKVQSIGTFALIQEARVAEELMRRRSRRLKLKAKPAPSTGRGAGT